MRIKILHAAVVCLLFLNTSAQEQPIEDQHFESIPRASLNKGLFGKVTESKTNKGIEAASVQVFALTRTSEGEKHDSLIAGMLTKPNGDFNFIDLTLPDSFSIRITALGFAENSKTVAMDRSETVNLGMDVGNLKLASEADLLGAVTVVAQRPTMQMGIDRKIFNVDKNITSTGGTAVDVMKNIPSVSVDVEGNVTMRNTSPQIFVDGRPTILTLQQIAADDIERIELITNPSAKFDAGSSGGIINVVLKKNKRLGINGIASVGTGTPDILNGNLSLNVRQGKLNFFGSVNYNRSGGLAKSESIRQNKDKGVITDYFNQQSETDRLRRFQNLRFGMDYFIDNRNTISLSQNFVKGRFSNFENQAQQFLDVNEVLVRVGSRTSDNNAQFKRSNTQFNYTHNFPKKGMDLTADVTYNTGNGFNRALISNYYNNPDGSQAQNPNLVRNNGQNENDQLTLQTDFVNPFSEYSKLEMGLRVFRQNNSNIYNAFSLNNSTEVKLPLSTNVRYDETVQAAYVTYSNKWKGIRFQAGLRGEYSKFNGLLVDSAQQFGYSLPVDMGHIFDGLFPSLYLTRELSEGKELQVNFSRRIRRPDFWQLNPFIDINDPLNIRQGNPQLRPEYTNSFELNYNHRYTDGNFMGVIYFRNNDDDITMFSDTISTAQYEKLNNAAVDPNAILNTFINAQYTNRVGAEFTVNQTFGKLEIVPNINMQYRKVKAIVGDLNLGNQGFNWQSKLMVNYKFGSTKNIFKNASVQLSSEYQSRQVIPQGRNKEQYQTDFAVRKEFLKNRVAAVTFAVNDVFNTGRWGQIYDTENFYQDAYRRWNVRNFRVNFSYRFGKSDFKIGQRENKKVGSDDD
ncbi:MAG TPA: outer membrane beta-barrel family protein [Flavitalea sp.]|nr:outer membrane beta-barrel family protein [Flavitalea sp.]